MYLSVFLLSLVIISSPAFALNGQVVDLVPSQLLRESAIAATGALMIESQLSDNAEGGDLKPLVHVLANAVYVGNNATGSVLLTSASEFSGPDREPSHDIWAGSSLRFGTAVTNFRAGVASQRTLHSLSGATLHFHPEFKNSKNADHALAVVQLTYRLPDSKRPVTVISKARAIPRRTSFYTFGFGHQAEEAFEKKALLPPYQQQLTSGFLMFTALKLAGTWPAQSMLRLSPLTNQDWQRLHQALPTQSDSLIDGPCAKDSGAPLFLLEDKLTPAPREAAPLKWVVKPQLTLVGLHTASTGTCRHPDPANAQGPHSAYLDLAEAKYADWIAGFLE